MQNLAYCQTHHHTPRKKPQARSRRSHPRPRTPRYPPPPAARERPRPRPRWRPHGAHSPPAGSSPSPGSGQWRKAWLRSLPPHGERSFMPQLVYEASAPIHGPPVPLKHTLLDPLPQELSQGGAVLIGKLQAAIGGLPLRRKGDRVTSRQERPAGNFTRQPFDVSRQSVKLRSRHKVTANSIHLAPLGTRFQHNPPVLLVACRGNPADLQPEPRQTGRARGGHSL